MVIMAGDIEELQASLLRTLASAQRLRILHVLGRGPVDVSDLAHTMGMSQATASQHLASLRSAGVVEAHRTGRCVRYEIADAGLLEACDLMRTVLVRRLTRLGDLAAAAGEPMRTAPSPNATGLQADKADLR
jgi:ArsR family transcriptional regulator, virulence genes transcriptional regulator